MSMHNPWNPNLKLDAQLNDGEQRLEAIDPTRSFIVQAPAGSGKTALLTQRFLSLLTRVESPEQVVAMTFTKKAAAEMRERVLGALKLGLLTQSPSDEAYDFNTWQLARMVLERDQQQGWRLLDNPNRLRIRTLDSMNGYLVQQMPFLSKLGTQPRLNENNDALYIEAARAVLRSDAVQQETAALLSLVNGRYARAENLLVSMLKKRDQWMRLILGAGGRDSMQNALAQLVQAELAQASMKLGALLEKGALLPDLAAFALSNKPELELSQLAKANWPLTADLSDIGAWRELASFVLTQKPDLRKTVTVANGFPTSDKAKKEQMIGVLADLSASLNHESIQALVNLGRLPDPYYSDNQWQALEHVITLLKHAVAHLTLAFKTAGQADFIEIAQAAAQALGDEDSPTDLALQLDYQLQHLLIDEFQDTSVAQFDLLKKLLRGWQVDDGRTLFIVGDPMQSIYRFREAEVGNFLQAWQGEALPVNLTPLNLTINFRSNASLVRWFNDTFKQVFPKQNQLVLGAVKYEHAKASPKAEANDQLQTAVFSHWALNQTPQDEVDQIVSLIHQKLTDFATDDKPKSIAVLGRSRSHLARLALGLKQQNIAFRAVELEALNERQEIQDLLALSRALLHASDRGAWLALLRTPFIGLDLTDLYALCGEDKTKLYAPLTQLLSDHQAWSSLTEAGQTRLHQAWLVLEKTLQHLGSQPFSRLVHQAWLSLGGPLSLESEVELENTQAFFEGLAQWDAEVLNQTKLDEWVTKLYASGDSSAPAQKVQLMTMHKSKGLQFDTVILPSLGKKPRSDDKALVSWLEFACDEGDGLVLAPLDQKGEASSPLNQLIGQVEQQKQSFEDARLLYVAATRAESELHLFGSVNLSSSQLKKQLDQDSSFLEAPDPQAKCLLMPLWNVVKPAFNALVEPEAKRLEAQQDLVDKPLDASERFIPKVKRLPLTRIDPLAWRAENRVSLDKHSGRTSLEKQERWSEANPLESETIQDKATAIWAGLSARKVGDLVHALLEQVVKQGLQAWSLQRVNESGRLYRQLLSQAGVRETDLDQAVERVQNSIKNALNHPKMQWALNPQLEESATELALTSQFDAIENHVVDRTFVADGVRWIIDYKTSRDRPTERTTYLQELVEQYRPQLARYGALFQALEQRPQKWVLYFSEMDEWVELKE